MTPFIVFAGAGVLGLGLRIAAGRSGRVRLAYRGLYASNWPIWLRNALPLAPMWSAGVFLFASLVLLPVRVAQWTSLPAFGLCVAAFVLSYRVPLPFLPGWMRQEIRDGIVVAARPDRADWVLFWLVVPFSALFFVALLSMLVWPAA